VPGVAQLNAELRARQRRAAAITAFLECGIPAHGFLRLRCGEDGHDWLLSFSCKRRGLYPSCSTRRLPQTGAHLVDHVIPQVPVRQWVLSRPIPLRVLLATQPEVVTPLTAGGAPRDHPSPAGAGRAQF